MVDSECVICPYCRHSYVPDSTEFSNDPREEECENCRETYFVWQEFYVEHCNRKKV